MEGLNGINTLRQGKDQSAIEFAGGLKQKQIKAEANDSMMLAVFLEGLKQTTARQVAILNPNSFTEAVDCVTRLESIDKGKGGPKISNTVSKLGGDQEEGASSALDTLAERFGVVLARLEAAPWFQKPRQGQGESAQNNSGYRQQSYEKKTVYDSQKGGRNLDQKPKPNKAPGEEAKRGMGHSTEACLWLKNHLREKPPRTYKDDREKRGENKESRN